MLLSERRKRSRRKSRKQKGTFLDEATFTSKTRQDVEYSGKRHNIEAWEDKQSEPAIAVVAAVSKEHGLLHFRKF